MRVNAKDEKFELVTLFGEKMLFTSLRIDKKTVPEGLYIYEIRHSDEDWGDPCQVAAWVFVNHYGTVISHTPIEFENISRINGNDWTDIDSEKDWNFLGETSTLDEFIKWKKEIKTDE
ncbi:MAG: hypothetical protein IJS94_07600 [Clostridia bacterium]|nr:hypothetical protein [Clostridia bacterium]